MIANRVPNVAVNETMAEIVNSVADMNRTSIMKKPAKTVDAVAAVIKFPSVFLCIQLLVHAPCDAMFRCGSVRVHDSSSAHHAKVTQAGVVQALNTGIPVADEDLATVCRKSPSSRDVIRNALLQSHNGAGLGALLKNNYVSFKPQKLTWWERIFGKQL